VFLQNERYKHIYQVFTNRSPDFQACFPIFSTVCLELATTIYFLIEMSQAVLTNITHSHGSARVL